MLQFNKGQGTFEDHIYYDLKTIYNGTCITETEEVNINLSDILKVRLKNFVEQNFPKDLVKLIRLENRQGLIQARMEGLRHVTSETVSFFDSHMEVNKDW